MNNITYSFAVIFTLYLFIGVSYGLVYEPVITAVPTAFPVTTPVPSTTVAFVGVDEIHLAPLNPAVAGSCPVKVSSTFIFLLSS